MSGKVWLVGAGPGDVGLFTLKGREVLRQADVVVYDALVGTGILNIIPKEAERIHVGKRSGHHTLTQDKINALLVEQAKEGKKVVRLKGGDPFLFGRGGEEVEALLEANIPYEIVPGVTSAIAVAAYNGIPVTHRDAVSSLHIITGHKKKGESLHMDFQALAKEDATLVFLMGISAMEEILEGLKKAGMDPEMPAAILMKGCSAFQKKLIGTISSLVQMGREQGIETPGILVVGKVCAYAQAFSWYEKLPLFGERILVTRPRKRASALGAKLRPLGCEVLELPSIETVPIEPNPALEEAFLDLSTYDYFVFTSPAGVEYFFGALQKAKKDIRSLGTGKIAAIGAGTRKELYERGIMTDLMPEEYSGEALGTLIGKDCQEGARILIPRARLGNEILVEKIKEQQKAEVVDLPIYDTKYAPSHQIDVTKEIDSGSITMACFTSASSVRGFVEQSKGADYTKMLAICIGEMTTKEAQKYGMPTKTAKEATMDSMVEAILEERQREI